MLKIIKQELFFFKDYILEYLILNYKLVQYTQFFLVCKRIIILPFV